MIVRKETLQELVGAGKKDEIDGFRSIEETLEDHSRWNLEYRQIIQHIESGKYYVTWYSRGATESQDESPYEYDDSEVELKEVKPVEKTIIVFE